MYVVGGTSFYGDRDSVPGLFHVANKCVHLYYVPLIPLGTYLVFDGTEQEEKTAWWRSTTRSSVQAIRLPFSLVPLLWSWMRLIFSLSALVGLVFGVAALVGEQPGRTALTLIAVGIAMALIGLYGLSTYRFFALAFLLLGVGAGLALGLAADALHARPWHLVGLLGVLALRVLEDRSYASRARAIELAIQADLPTQLIKDYFQANPHLAVRQHLPTPRLPSPRLPKARALTAPPAPTARVPLVAPPPSAPPPVPGEEPRLLQ